MDVALATGGGDAGAGVGDGGAGGGRRAARGAARAGRPEGWLARPRVGILEVEPPKCGPWGGDPDEAALLPEPGVFTGVPEGCPNPPPPGAIVV